MLLQLCLALLFSGELRQTTTPTPAEARLASYEKRQELAEASPLGAWPFRSVGPRIMGARIVDIIGFSDKPETYLAAYASGGLWRTTNSGTTWEPLFDDTPSITIGAIAVNPNDPNEIWVGTGEHNSSRSSYAGTGIHLTRDGGRTWTNMGLHDSHHISRIIVHPADPNTLYVAVIGHLYSTNEERGLFRSRDKGKTWKKILYIDEKTGVIDVEMDPTDPKRLYAAAWQRHRLAWDFTEAGEGSGLYISEDGGDSWKEQVTGLPKGEHMGRIGLSISKANPSVIYACVDNQGTYTSPEPDPRPLTKKKLATMDKEAFLALDDKVISDFLRQNEYHRDITVERLREQLMAGQLEVADLHGYLYDGNSALFDREVYGVEVYRSNDRGLSWTKTHEKPIPDFAWSYGYYFGLIEADPVDVNTFYVGAVPLLKSTDGGKTFTNIMRSNVHVDHHALWIDPKKPNHLVLGNDGGINMSWDAGREWQRFNYQAVGQFYTVAYDMATPYNIYGGLQDNGVWFGSSSAQGRYDDQWHHMHSGDGAFVQVDPRDNTTVYSGYQFGHYYRTNRQTGERITIFPRHQLKEKPLRYNWMTPLVLSSHHPDILYMGANRVLRSMDMGETWEPISDDLTTDPQGVGDVPFGTLTCLRESPHTFGTLYAGSDDGRLWVTRGTTWTEIGADMTQGLWVSSIETSPHAEGGVFVTLTGYRNDDFKTYVFASDDFGATWRDMRGNLPDEPCNVIRQDPKNDKVFYLGTDVGFWITFDGGNNWYPHHQDMPKVPVYAMEIHPREHELIVATHGRSIFVLDLEPTQFLTEDNLAKGLFVHDPPPIPFSRGWGQKMWPWDYAGEKPDHLTLTFLASEPGTVGVVITRDGEKVHEREVQATRGINYLDWDFQVTPEQAGKTTKRKKKKSKKAAADQPEVHFHVGANGSSYAIAGEYKIELRRGDEATFTTLVITPGS